MKLRVYLDTTVFSAAFDGKRPERKAQTEALWGMSGHFVLSTSDLTRRELAGASDPGLHDGPQGLLGRVNVHPLTAEMKELARWYVELGAFPPLFLGNALHVACCVLTNQDILLSWDFRNLVNRRTRSLIDVANDSASLRRVEILTPPEM